MSNGYLSIQSCTIVANETHGYQRTDDLGKSNLAGGVAATIGNAHAVEEMFISHSIVAGNTITELGATPVTYDHDLFTGSLLHFNSGGYNRIGAIDFSQILVPVGQWGWKSLSRKHYPQNEDVDGVSLSDVVDLASGITRSNHVVSVGVDASQLAVLYYQPTTAIVDLIPPQPYTTTNTYFEYTITGSGTNDFLEILLHRIESHYELDDFAATFIDDFEYYLQNEVDTDDETAGNQPYKDPNGNPIDTLAATQWFGPVATWPSNVANYAYIDFWHRLDDALQNEAVSGMGPELLGDAAWQALFDSGPLDENTAIIMIKSSENSQTVLLAVDQLGQPRPVATHGDIGAIERQ